jgi:hypothetical protein
MPAARSERVQGQTRGSANQWARVQAEPTPEEVANRLAAEPLRRWSTLPQTLGPRRSKNADGRTPRARKLRPPTLPGGTE